MRHDNVREGPASPLRWSAACRHRRAPSRHLVAPPPASERWQRLGPALQPCKPLCAPPPAVLACCSLCLCFCLAAPTPLTQAPPECAARPACRAHVHACTTCSHVASLLAFQHADIRVIAIVTEEGRNKRRGGGEEGKTGEEARADKGKQLIMLCEPLPLLRTLPLH